MGFLWFWTVSTGKAERGSVFSVCLFGCWQSEAQFERLGLNFSSSLFLKNKLKIFVVEWSWGVFSWKEFEKGLENDLGLFWIWSVSTGQVEEGSIFLSDFWLESLIWN